MPQKLNMLSQNLRVFRPELVDIFVCPTCLKQFNTSQFRKEITEAHIIPRAVGGKKTTFLCKSCNSQFGTKQDKWFGELIKLNRGGLPALFASNVRDGHFKIDGEKVNGFWKQGSEGALEFYIDTSRNPPEIAAAMLRKFGDRPPSIDLNMSFPLMRKTRLARLGLLTAGYLMWFEALGYSWVYQSHLDQLREQILSPEEEILKGPFVASVKGVEWSKPWIGLLLTDELVIPVMGYLTFMAMYPPRDAVDLYSRLASGTHGIVPRDVLPLPGINLEAGLGFGVMVANRLVIAPDKIFEENEHPFPVIFFPPDSREHRILAPISEEKANSIETRPDVKHIKIKLEN